MISAAIDARTMFVLSRTHKRTMGAHLTILTALR